MLRCQACSSSNIPPGSSFCNICGSRQLAPAPLAPPPLAPAPPPPQEAPDIDRKLLTAGRIAAGPPPPRPPKAHAAATGGSRGARRSFLLTANNCAVAGCMRERFKRNYCAIHAGGGGEAGPPPPSLPVLQEGDYNGTGREELPGPGGIIEERLRRKEQQVELQIAAKHAAREEAGVELALEDERMRLKKEQEEKELKARTRAREERVEKEKQNATFINVVINDEKRDKGLISASLIEASNIAYVACHPSWARRVIALDFPVEKKGTLHKKKLLDVFMFLEESHAGMYKVYNVSDHIPSSALTMFNPLRLTNYLVHSTRPCPLNQMLDFCMDAVEWIKGAGLGEEGKTVVLVGDTADQTGLLAIALIFYTQQCTSIEEAASTYCSAREISFDAFWPSQKRYLLYFAKLISTPEKVPDSRKISLSCIQIRPRKHAYIRKSFLTKLPLKELTFSVVNAAGKIWHSAEKKVLLLENVENDSLDFMLSETDGFLPRLTGEFTIVFQHPKLDADAFEVHCNTRFVPKRKDGTYQLSLTKFEVDDVHADTGHKVFPETFEIELLFVESESAKKQGSVKGGKKSSKKSGSRASSRRNSVKESRTGKSVGSPEISKMSVPSTVSNLSRKSSEKKKSTHKMSNEDESASKRGSDKKGSDKKNASGSDKKKSTKKKSNSRMGTMERPPAGSVLQNGEFPDYDLDYDPETMPAVLVVSTPPVPPPPKKPVNFQPNPPLFAAISPPSHQQQLSSSSPSHNPARSYNFDGGGTLPPPVAPPFRGSLPPRPPPAR